MNNELLNELRDVTKIQLGAEKIPNITAVIDVNPKHARIINVIKSITSDGDLISATPDRDFYIVAAAVSNTATAAAAGTASYIVANVGGVSSRILEAKHPASTAASENVVLSFPIPILIDRNTAITAAGGSGLTFRAIIYGYFVETIKA